MIYIPPPPIGPINIGGGGGGWMVRWGFKFLGTHLLSELLLHSYEHIKFLSSSPADWHPSGAYWIKGASVLHDSEVNATCMGMGSGLCEGKGAASQSKFSGQWQCQGRYAWASAAQFLPHNSAATCFVSMVGMQADVELEKEKHSIVEA
eukprot:320094-Pelagomonas_calceolata.AAC.1